MLYGMLTKHYCLFQMGLPGPGAARLVRIYVYIYSVDFLFPVYVYESALPAKIAADPFERFPAQVGWQRHRAAYCFARKLYVDAICG